MNDLREESIETRTHGRMLVRDGNPRLVLVGFHGYAENADRAMADLLRLPGVENWTLVAIQGLHRFYNNRTREVIASWMTSQNREQLLADNIEYVRRAVTVLGNPEVLVFSGFSQGTAMAYRAAAHVPATALLILGGDLPDDVQTPLPLTLIGRGTGDEWFTAEKLDRDVARLRSLAKEVRTLVYEGGHEWSDAYRQAASELLQEVRAARNL
ncbi:MAG: hypothetical protein JOZ54_15975 [Acidobacteria bacterium]|nr:hypothetical protein [Acidobacteriota bacterium]